MELTAETANLLPEVDVEQVVSECHVPFPADAIKIRNDAGTGGKDLSYVGHPDYTRRLDRLFPFAWSFHTEVVGLTDTTVGVKGSLSITLEDGRVITRENYGHGNINRGFPLGDAMKTACVDALKKCCSMFGIGLHLYDGDSDLANRASTNGQASNNGQHHNPQDDPFHPDWEPPPREQSDARFEVGDGEAATSKQIVALQNIAKSSKTDGDLADEINRKLKTPPAAGKVRITKKEASELISKAFDDK